MQCGQSERPKGQVLSASLEPEASWQPDQALGGCLGRLWWWTRPGQPFPAAAERPTGRPWLPGQAGLPAVSGPRVPCRGLPSVFLF